MYTLIFFLKPNKCSVSSKWETICWLQCFMRYQILQAVMWCAIRGDLAYQMSLWCKRTHLVKLTTPGVPRRSLWIVIYLLPQLWGLWGHRGRLPSLVCFVCHDVTQTKMIQTLLRSYFSQPHAICFEHLFSLSRFQILSLIMISSPPKWVAIKTYPRKS